MEVTYDEAKLTELVLYVAGRLRGDRSGGATKLNKVLYFADFAHTRQHGRPITGAEYRKLPQGPAPRRLKPVRDGLIETKQADLVEDTFLGYRLDRLVPLRDADTSLFTEKELATIDKVLDDLSNLTSTQVSELSHAEPWWSLLDEGDVVPYDLAFIPQEQVSTPTSRRLAAEVARRYGLLPG
jgi:hypothetical protein